MGGGRGRMGGSGGAGSSGARGTAEHPHGGGDQGDALRAQMAANHAALVSEALDALDTRQRATARKLLADSDYDLPDL
jgi:hypothetical protein